MLIALLAVGFVGYVLIGFVFGLLWYVLVIGVLAAIGYGGYKILKASDEPAQIESKPPVVIGEMKNVDRALEEYKRKYLPK